ncbi:hypothetical protein ACFC25_16310 [Pseudarthrobacter sp. NPDC055928]|uniref:hypothetical protein n=1 Tax=Pseudarthrobacter sp. NPDC055928 TaxID=3345661 RepID=UPI0035DABAAF
MNAPPQVPPPEGPSPPLLQPSPSTGPVAARGASHGFASLMFAIAAPLSLVGTLPMGVLFNVGAYYLAAPMYVYRFTPLIVLSVPTISGLVSVGLAIVSLTRTPATSPSRASAVAALCINAVVFTFGLIFTMPHLRHWFFD